MHVLHHHVEIALGLDDVQDGDDVRLPDPRGEARLVEEHLPERGVGGEAREQALDRNDAREAARADDAPEVDAAHAAGGELFAERGSAPR